MLNNTGGGGGRGLFSVAGEVESLLFLLARIANSCFGSCKSESQPHKNRGFPL